MRRILLIEKLSDRRRPQADMALGQHRMIKTGVRCVYVDLVR